MNTQRERLAMYIGYGLVALAWAGWMARGHAQTAPRPNGSLWTSASRGLCEDTRAHKVGDTVTIVVAESTTATSSAATKTSRADSAKFNGMTGGFKTLNNVLQPFGLSNSASTDGSGQTSRSGTLTTRLSAVIKEQLPNGNLVVEGTRTVGVNAEKQKVVISGIVRPQDIGPDNTISSVYLANASVQVDGKGPIGDRQRKGLISTILHWLF
jgi:flagellar L-ring protein precursor FlgH